MSEDPKNKYGIPFDQQILKLKDIVNNVVQSMEVTHCCTSNIAILLVSIAADTDENILSQESKNFLTQSRCHGFVTLTL